MTRRRGWEEMVGGSYWRFEGGRINGWRVGRVVRRGRERREKVGARVADEESGRGDGRELFGQ